MSIFLDAGPSLNFLAVGQENILIQLAATPALRTWGKLKSANRVIVLSDALTNVVRGRGLRRDVVPAPAPELGIYLLGAPPPAHGWDSRWVQWRDFWVPSSPAEATAVLTEAWAAAADRRVELACEGGLGRTGTALAALP